MRKIIFLVSLTLALPAAAQAQEPGAITVRGHNFLYQKTDLSPRTYKLVGQMTDGRHFRLSVKGPRVSGYLDGRPVNFVVTNSGGGAADTVLASLS